MPGPRRATLAVAALVALALVAAGCAGDENSSSPTVTKAAPTTLAIPETTVPNGDFYATPSPIPAGRPGDVVRIEAMTGAPAGTSAWRVMYLSTGMTPDERVVVTGTVIAPNGAAPDGGRKVVTWAHPTTGIEDACAPSLSAQPFGAIEGLDQYLAEGWVVVSTDYQGLGTDGMHPYLVGDSEAHGVIDIVRAAQKIPEAGAGSEYAVYGHSQGGQAALFTGQIASTYAPELDLKAVAAAAPAGLLTELFNDDKDTLGGALLGSYAVVSWVKVFGFDATTVVTPATLPQVQQIAAACLSGLTPQVQGDIVTLSSGSMWVGNPSTTPPWAAQFQANSAGGAPIPVPVLVAQGTADDIVIPATTAQLVAKYQAEGTQITEQQMAGVTHTDAGAAGVQYVMPFFQKNLG